MAVSLKFLVVAFRVLSRSSCLFSQTLVVLLSLSQQFQAVLVVVSLKMKS